MENVPPIIRSDGNRNVLTTDCSKPMWKKIMIGIHIAISLADTLVDSVAPTTPVDTIQLHGTPRMNSVSLPAAPCDSWHATIVAGSTSPAAVRHASTIWRHRCDPGIS